MYLREGILIIVAISCWDVNAALNDTTISSNDAVWQKNLSLAINSFSRDFLKILAHASNPEENVFMSTASIYAGLCLLHLGATGSSRKELTDAMKLPKDENQLEELHKNLGQMFKSLTVNETWTLESIMANGMFLQKDFQIKDEYLQKLKAYYPESLVDQVDFLRAEELARNRINKWVNESTNGRIPEVCTEPFDPETKIVLANAVFYSARWGITFEKHLTKADKFNTGSTQIDVQMMTHTDHIRYYNSSSLQFEMIELPYVGNTFFMYFLLPYETQNVTNLMEHLGPAEMQEIHQQLKGTAVEYSVPRMKFKSSQSLNEPLRQMGLKNIYTAAELGDMAFAKNLKLSEVKHGAEIEVQEEGTTASAATIVVVGGRSLPIHFNFKDPVKFKLNRPFLFCIAHRSRGMPLFTGIVRKP